MNSPELGLDTAPKAYSVCITDLPISNLHIFSLPVRTPTHLFSSLAAIFGRLMAVWHHFVKRTLALGGSPHIWRKPADYFAINCTYGWVYIPKSHFSPWWTSKTINSYLADHLKEVLDEQKLPDKYEVQRLVDEWVTGIPIEDVPAVEKLTKQDLKRQKDQALYRSQLKEDVGVVTTPGPDKERQPRVRAPNSQAVSFIHAWNYYFATHHKEYAHLGGKMARKQVALNWNMMSVDQKEVYREAYADLLLKGQDIYKGKIVDRELKLQRTGKSKKL